MIFVVLAGFLRSALLEPELPAPSLVLCPRLRSPVLGFEPLLFRAGGMNCGSLGRGELRLLGLAAPFSMPTSPRR